MSESTFALTGLTTVVTGSSSGIGRAIAIRLASLGSNILLHGRGPSTRLDQVQEHIQSETSVSVSQQYCDFTNPEGLSTFAEQAWNWQNGVDVWINNAGGDVLTGIWKDKSLIDKFDYLMDVDVKATLLLSKQIGERMQQCNNDFPGSIINIGWDQAWQGMEGESGELFATTKGAIMSMTKSLAQSLAPKVRVNCIAPGWIKTAWGEQTTSKWDERAQNESLMNRWGTPHDVADAVAFLAGPAAKFVSGQILPVNGGFRFGS